MNEVAVVVPCLARPHRVAKVLETFSATAPASVLFIADPDDVAVIAALEEAEAKFVTPGGNYATKIRAGVLATSEPFIFTAADDLEGLDGWFDAAVAAITDVVQVVGVNDLIEREREHATHFLMTRGYAEQDCIDGTPGPFFAGYHHWYCDDELIGTAEHRGAYAYCPQAKVLHLHPMAGKAKDDSTYELGRRQWRRDRKLFRRRQHRWM